MAGFLSKLDKLDKLEQIEQKLDTLIKEVNKMAVDQATFDSDLSSFLGSVTALIAAIEAWVTTHPDLTAEDQEVVTAASAVSAEITKLTPPAPPAA